MNYENLVYVPAMRTELGTMPGHYLLVRSEAELRQVLADGAVIANTLEDWRAYEREADDYYEGLL